MSGGSVTGNQFLDTGLMIAAGVAAPELALAVAPEEMMATAGGAALATGIAGAGTSALAAGITGHDVGKAALMGGVAGGLGGYMGGAATPGGPTGAEINAAPTPMSSDISVPDNMASGMSSEYIPPQMPTQNPIVLSGSTPMSITGQPLPPSVSPNLQLTQSSMIPGISKAGMYSAGILGANELLKPPQVTMPQSTTGGVPDALKYSFDRNTYQPSIAPYYNGARTNYEETPYARQLRRYADGGTVEQMSRVNALGGNQMFPQSGIGGLTGANTYQNATNTPTPNNVLEPTDAVTDPYTGAMKMATGGIAGYAKGGDLGSYSDGGQMLKGPGDGMSDDIPARIGKHQPARLADGEFVVPADVVSHLGNGSTDAGAKHLYAMMDKVRSARTGRKAQGKQIKPEKYLPA